MSIQTLDDLRAVSPALARYAETTVQNDLWRRPGQSPRDRSIVTLAALIARSQTIDLDRELAMALDHGVQPAEISEVITHLAFYTGWSNALSAVPVAKRVFETRGIAGDQLPAATGRHLPPDEAAEARRAARVDADVGSVSPGLVQYTGELLSRDLWLRPALAPRNRSLVTVSALIASGQIAQVTFRLDDVKHRASKGAR